MPTTKDILPITGSVIILGGMVVVVNELIANIVNRFDVEGQGLKGLIGLIIYYSAPYVTGLEKI